MTQRKKYSIKKGDPCRLLSQVAIYSSIFLSIPMGSQKLWGQEAPIQIVEDYEISSPASNNPNTTGPAKTKQNQRKQPVRGNKEKAENILSETPFGDINNQPQANGGQISLREAQKAPEAPMRNVFQTEQNIILPINIVGLQFEGAPKISSTYGENEAIGLISQLNQIYKQYGIEWKLNNSKSIKISKDMYQEVHFPESLRSFTTKVSRAVNTPGTGTGSKAIPSVYVTKGFPEGADEIATPLNIPKSILFAEKSSTTGKGNPNVLAHELGHLLGLADIPKNEGNLMSVTRPKVLASTKLYSHQLSLIRKNATKQAEASKTALVAQDQEQTKNTKSGLTTTSKSVPQQAKSGPTIFRQVGNSEY